jgi:hypothetical protein
MARPCAGPWLHVDAGLSRATKVHGAFGGLCPWHKWHGSGQGGDMRSVVQCSSVPPEDPTPLFCCELSPLREHRVGCRYCSLGLGRSKHRHDRQELGICWVAQLRQEQMRARNGTWPSVPACNACVHAHAALLCDIGSPGKCLHQSRSPIPRQ